MKKIYITGVSGTGKTTIYEELKKRGFTAISLDETDDLCCWASKKTKEKVERQVELNIEFTSTHDWICDIEYLKKLLAKETDKDMVFVLGVASNQKEFLTMFDKVLVLQCKPETFLHRLTHRTNNEFGKDETVRSAVLGWYQEFESELLLRGAISIDTDKPLNEVVEEVLRQAGI
ncbi:MAG: AAA family ATPase [Candidatus Pacebacteria bacterium]|jgi:broad-specificity NMP kinase|nr:AAA family ATPase [Candidatus Paceibacterota bacterium]